MEVQKHINSLRQFLCQSKDWDTRFSQKRTREVILHTFKCKVDDFDLMTNKQFALAIVSHNGNAVCCIPESVWVEVKEEAINMLKLQMMAGTFPAPLPDKSSMFSFVVDEGLKMFGWQPLLYVVAAGADRVDMFGNNDDWEVAYYNDGKHIRNFPMPKGADNKPICIVQKLVDTEGMDHTTRVSIDIYSGTISCTGSVTRPVPFEAQGSIYQAKPVSIESMISRAGHSTLKTIKIQASR